MVFQSYALYPHLTVYDNIAFGLRLKKMPKQQIDERVQDAARTLGLEDLLKRKPRNLSGGQRQRVAMGRAIVREPAAFLMDEPLSNLDAKLRVQMRAEISRLQRDLGVTTIYVTHDQVEAMTMGDRVAVMRKGELQQVGRPADALRPPGQPLRRRLHRLAGDEHGRGDDRAAKRQPSRSRSAARRSSWTRRRPQAVRRSESYEGRAVILGIRPEHLEDVSLAPDTPPDRRLRGHGRAPRGARLGADGALHRRGRPRRPRPRRRKELARDVGTRPRGRHRDRRTRCSSAGSAPARTSPRASRSRCRSTRARCISSTPRRVSGSTTRQQRKEQHREHVVGLGGPPSCAGGRPLAVARRIEQRLRRDEGATQRRLGEHHVRRRLDRRRGEAPSAT